VGVWRAVERLGRGGEDLHRRRLDLAQAMQKGDPWGGGEVVPVSVEARGRE
jgi:hypothetical protein